MKMNYLKSYFFPLLLLILLLIVASPIMAATQSAVIDFEGLAKGTIVSSLSDGNGISGDPIAGSVSVFGSNPRYAANGAVIFDATCGGSPATCTSNGEDADLYYPAQGNILILAKRLADQNMDGLVDDPNDDDLPNMFFEFDFTGYGPGVVTVEEFTVMDVEEDENEGDAQAEFYSGGNLVAVVAIPDTGDNGIAIVPVGVSGVDFMRITLNGSGAIDNIRVSVDMPDDSPGTGTPGYWKNHPEAWPVDSITIGGITYSKADAIAYMQMPVQGDKTKNMFAQLVSAKLNVLIGNESSCIDQTIADADAWMALYPVGSGVGASSAAWQVGEPLHNMLDAYNNGLLCAPPRD